MKNAEIMREIARLRQNRATVADMEKNPGSGRGAGAELESLRMRKVELEFRQKRELRYQMTGKTP